MRVLQEILTLETIATLNIDVRCMLGIEFS